MLAFLRRAGLLFIMFYLSAAILSLVFVPQNITPANVLSAVTNPLASGYSESGYRFSDIDAPIDIVKSPATNTSYGYKWQSSKTNEGAYYEMIDYELSKYKHRDFEKINLRRIYLVEDLQTHDGKAVLGFADLSNRYLYLNVLHDRANTALVKSTVHHEIGHFVTIQALGSGVLTQETWQGTAYSNIGENRGYEFPSPGFVSSYSKTSAAEDMAEVYAYLMVDEYKVPLIENSKNDPVLTDKINHINYIINSLELSFAE